MVILKQILHLCSLLYKAVSRFFWPEKKQLHTDRLAVPSELADITSAEMDGHSLLMGVTDDGRILSEPV